jgi:hypothetical protein
LSLIMFGAFAVFLVLQSIFGWQTANAESRAHDQPETSYTAYLTSGEFVEATFENWESEFLQIGSYVLLTAYFVQRGSAESKPTDAEDDEGRVTAGSPLAARGGGIVRGLYEHSLAIALLGLFALSFVLHLLGGTAAYNSEQAEHGGEAVSVIEFLFSSEFWFQSMQNWQSEFLAVGVLVVATIFLRQRKSPQSKPVNAPSSQTGA